MKKIYLFILSLVIVSSANATMYNIVPSAGGASYTPSLVTVVVGDVVQFGNSPTYPCAEVSQATWLANGTTTLVGGFGIKTNSYTFTVTASTGTIYFVCTTKVASNGTKGIVQLSTASGITANHYTSKHILLFPNPAKEELTISLPPEFENVKVKLFALSGQEIDVIYADNSVTLPNSFSINLPSTIANGVYFLEIVSGSERIYKKVSISK